MPLSSVVPEGVTDEEAALVEPAAGALETIFQTPPRTRWASTRTDAAGLKPVLYPWE